MVILSFLFTEPEESMETSIANQMVHKSGNEIMWPSQRNHINDRFHLFFPMVWFWHNQSGFQSNLNQIKLPST